MGATIPAALADRAVAALRREIGLGPFVVSRLHDSFCVMLVSVHG
jgi:hypothetical protein